MTAREKILARIRATTRAVSSSGDSPTPLPLRTLSATDPSKSLAALFGERLEAVDGVCHRTSSAGAAIDALRAIIADGHARRVARTDDARIVEMLEGIVGTFEVETPASPRERLLACDVGISTAAMGIAEHGTIVLPTGGDPLAERTRFVALLPKVHVAILKASDLRGTIHETLQSLGELPPTVTFATGPSRTADIEQELVLGVHGPHAQHVIILEHE